MRLKLVIPVVVRAPVTYYYNIVAARCHSIMCTIITRAWPLLQSRCRPARPRSPPVNGFNIIIRANI